MPRINFFIPKDPPTYQKEFGLCDDIEHQPARIDEDLSNKDTKWLGVVHNDNGKKITFYPVDNYVEMRREDGTMDSRCEGILRYEGKNLIFAELKNRKLKSKSKSKKANWRRKAEEQIITTLKYFFDNYDKNAFDIKAWIGNKRQLVEQDYSVQIADFKRETEIQFGIANGINLKIQREIDIEKM